MTQEEIIDMARQAGVKKATAPSGTVGDYFWGTPHQLEAFAKLVAAKERDEWAKEFAGLGEWTAVHILEARGEA